jgi:hypothetical protein
MNRHYISDVYEPHERAALRAEGRHIGLVLAIATAMVVLLALLVWPRPTHAQEAFKLPVPSCYFEHIDYRYELGDPYDAIIWWCDAESGLEENYRTGELGGIREFLFRVNAAGKDLWQADRQIFVRALTPRESTLVQRLSTAGEPRCVFATTAKTTQVLSKSLDAPLDRCAQMPPVRPYGGPRRAIGHRATHGSKRARNAGAASPGCSIRWGGRLGRIAMLRASW